MSRLSGLTVLLIEDEFLIALDAQQILMELGARKVEIVSNFDQAQQRAEQADFDIAVLDVNLNGKLSFPIAATFRNRGVPVVFASGYQLRERPPEGFEGAVSVSKPYTADRLKEALCTALGGDK